LNKRFFIFQKAINLFKNFIPYNICIINDSVVDVYRSAKTNSERVTQTLLCQEVNIEREILGWTKVEVVDGYIGWVKSDKIYKTINNPLPTKVVIKSKMKSIFSAMNGTSIIKEITLGTELPVIEKINNWYKVDLTMNRIGWLEDTDTLETASGTHILKTTGIDFVDTAKKFLGVPYLWGGVSAWGIDCSGLTYICCRVNGVDLPRDAQPQYYSISTSINPNPSDMKPGDLLFFSSKPDSKKYLNLISHVGIYIGNNDFIHASGSIGSVTITSLSDEYFTKRLVGVKRVFEN